MLRPLLSQRLYDWKISQNIFETISPIFESLRRSFSCLKLRKCTQYYDPRCYVNSTLTTKVWKLFRCFQITFMDTWKHTWTAKMFLRFSCNTLWVAASLRIKNFKYFFLFTIDVIRLLRKARSFPMLQLVVKSVWENTDCTVNVLERSCTACFYSNQFHLWNCSCQTDYAASDEHTILEKNCCDHQRNGVLKTFCSR